MAYAVFRAVAGSGCPMARAFVTGSFWSMPGGTDSPVEAYPVGVEKQKIGEGSLCLCRELRIQCIWSWISGLPGV